MRCPAILPAALSLRCVRGAWGSALGPFALLAGFLAAWGVTALYGSMLVKAQPVAVNIQSITVHDAPPGTVERSLRIEMESPPAGNCTRTSQHLLRQGPLYFPLGSALNGMGFSGSVARFTIVLSLPTAMPAGDYEYLQRSSYTCSWLGGFVQRRIMYQSLAMPVTIAAAR